jgi:osmoprotectant transport system ATP-binding protein
VGVARALAADPPIVLMDEPFGALDPITREQLQNEFLELESEIRKTVVFVTHDVFEAAKIGDRIALLDAGRLQQLEIPSRLVANPANEFVDQFLGQQRFQLSLLTRTIRAILPQADSAESEVALESRSPALCGRDSLLHSLDLFKQAGVKELPVHEAGRRIGTLTKDRLLREITNVLAETGES